jgi:transposase
VSERTRKKYTQEFKEDAVKLVTEQGYKISEAARNLGIGANMLGRWKKEFEEEANGLRLPSDERAELSRLREENRRLKMEREILKKAAAHLSRTSQSKI